MQSHVFDSVYSTDSNVLVSAPTGAGKTDVALLAVLRALDGGGKAVYIAPMKALATEITGKYNRIFQARNTDEATGRNKAISTLKDRMKQLSVGRSYKAIEYTGDTEIDATTANLADVVVCTPEKFDVSTRRLSPIFSGIKLVVIDEIHLLNDDRGPVLEAIVARMFRLTS